MTIVLPSRTKFFLRRFRWFTVVFHLLIVLFKSLRNVFLYLPLCVTGPLYEPTERGRGSVTSFVQRNTNSDKDIMNKDIKVVGSRYGDAN